MSSDIPRMSTRSIPATRSAALSRDHSATLTAAVRAALRWRTVSTGGAALLAAGLAVAPIAAAAPFPAVFELSSLDGTNGFVIKGARGESTSFNVNGAGDVNGDGIADVIIGAPTADPHGIVDSGRDYVVFGSAAPFPASIDLSSVDGSNSFVLNGINAEDKLGTADAAGDVNGDGVDDVIASAPPATSNGVFAAGQSYVVFGSTGLPAELDLSTLDGRNGFALNGITERSRSGWSVSGAGDFNGDGIDDVIISTSEDVLDYGQGHVDHPHGIGHAYAVFGRSSGFPAALNLSSLDGSNGIVLAGIYVNDFARVTVSGAGDVNDDGIDDVIIGSPIADVNDDIFVGASYVVFGSRAGFPPLIDLPTLDGTNGFVLTGAAEFDRAGVSASSAGDVNGDGVSDVIVGAPYVGVNAGAAYVVFGNSAGFAAVVSLSSLDGSNGFVLNGANDSDFTGCCASSAGDINGDGLGDVIVGAREADPNGIERAGATYVVFGSAAPFPAALSLSSLDGANGFVINGIHEDDFSGTVSSAGDVNADGVDDIIIGAQGADPHGRPEAGEAYVVFGHRIADTDGDGLSDDADNCTLVANADQVDVDEDGIGNPCDADFDDDCIVSFRDLNQMKTVFFHTGSLEGDMNGDGSVNFIDLALLKTQFFEPPGPSGVPNICSARESD